MRISGLRKFRCICRRSTWKYCAGVVEHGAALAEGAGRAGMAAEAGPRALQQERPEGQRLRERPVDRLALLHLGAADFELAEDLRVDREMLGHPRQGFGDGPQGL